MQNTREGIGWMGRSVACGHEEIDEVFGRELGKNPSEEMPSG